MSRKSQGIRVFSLIVVFGALLGLGWWGLAADRSTAPTLGEEIAVPGGHYTVVAAWTVGDPMMAMHDTNMSQFAQSGMSMSQMLPDAVPEGYKRVAVQVTVEASQTELRFPESGISLELDDTRVTPYVTLLGDQRLDAASRIDGVVTFEVPEDWTAAVFRLTGNGPSAVVDLTGSNHPDDH